TKYVEVEEGEIEREVGDDVHDQTVGAYSVPDFAMQKDVEDIDTWIEEEIEEELIKKNM
ncbi:hypothetical protein KI387_028100, partial [Taxus chinensis]